MHVWISLLDYNKLLGLGGKDNTQPRTVTVHDSVTCATCHTALHNKALDGKSLMSRTPALFMKFSKSHIKSFETHTEALFSLTFGGSYLLNLHTGPSAWEPVTCGKQVFNHFSQAHETECCYIYRGLWRPPKHGGAIIYQKPLS